MRVTLIILAFIIGRISTNQIEPPKLTIVATSAGIHVSWTPVIIPNCFITYQVTHRIQGVEQSNRGTDSTYMVFPFTSCVEHTFILEPVCRTGADATDSVTETIITGISDDLQVENLDFTRDGNSLSATWSRPEDAVVCKDVEYHLSLSISDRFHTEISTQMNSHIFEVETIPPCAFVILTVTPVDDRGSGASKAAYFVAETAANVGGIQDLRIDNGRIEWMESQDNAYCKVIYMVTIKSNSGNQEEFSTRDRFLQADFVPCEEYTVTVTSIVDDTAVNTLRINYIATASNIGQVENLQITEINDEIAVSWSPLVIGICDVQYKLRYHIDGVLEGTVVLSDTTYDFPTYHCAENLVVLQAIIDETTGETIEATITSSSAKPGQVENIVANLDDNSFLVHWEPVVVGRCAIEYQIEHITQEGQSASWIQLPLVYMNRIPCSHNEVRISAIAGPLIGPPSSIFVDIDINDLPRVEGLTVAEVEAGLLVSWAPILKGLCNVVYSISNFDGENSLEYETELTSYTISKTNCANNTVTVFGIERNSQVISPSNYYVVEVDIDLSEVTNLKVDQISDGALQINWDKPTYTGNCVLEYLVSIRFDDEQHTFEARTSDTNLEAVIDIKPCSKFEVSVTPISPKGRKGLTLTEKNTANLFRVNPVTNLVKHQGTLTWERPQEAGVCELSYRVTVIDENETIIKEVETSETSIEFDMQPCRSYKSHVKVVDVLTKSVSETNAVEGIGTPRFIEEITSIEYEINNSELKLSWTAAVAGDCLVIYDIIHVIDNEPILSVTIDNSVVLEAVACSTNNITITPVLQQDMVIGNPFKTSIFVGLDALGAVEDIAVENNLLIWWAPPHHSGNCPLIYVVDIFDSTGLLIESVVTKEIYVEWRFSPCANYLLRITPHYDDMVGVPTVVRFNALEVVHDAPKHVRTIPSLFSADIKLEATPFAENSCPLKELRIICDESFGSEAHIDAIIPIEDNVERIFEIKLTELTQDTFYKCKAQWIGGQESELSEIFEFLTVEITPLFLEIGDVTSNEITISWEIPRGGVGSVISHFKVEVTTVGPNHFLPESCDVKRNFAENFTLPRSQETFTLTDALPNFRYQFSLIIVYTLGFEIRTQMIIVNTLPGAPGPIIDLTSRFEMEDCARYVGSGFFRWTLPCDINGALNGFIVDLNIFYDVTGTSRSDTVATVLHPNDNQYIFSVQIPVLNPFFNYSISIITDAAFRAIAPDELRAVPPKAYTYCPSG